MAATIVSPPPDRKADQWANECRWLPSGSAEKGKYAAGRTPYMIPIARAFSIWSLREIFWTMARQMGKTNGGAFNVMGHKLDDDPIPILYIGPTRDNIDDVIEPKVQYLLESTRSLWAKTLRGQKCKKHAKIVGGVSLRFAWAGSDTGLKADAAGLVLIDEIDGIEADRPTAGEGTIKDMAGAITSSFPEGCIGVTSTPTFGAVDSERHPLTGLDHWAVSEEVTSAIWRYFQEATRHEWAWPCPHCKVYFIPRSKHLKPVEDVTPEEAEAAAHVECPNCRGKILDRHRSWANARGVMIAPGQAIEPYDPAWGHMGDDGAVGDGPLLREDGPLSAATRIPWGDFILPKGARSASFWVSGLCSFSQKNSFGYMANSLVKAIKSLLPQRIQGVLNTLFGECHMSRGTAPPWTDIRDLARRGSYVLGEVPAPVTTLTAYADVSDDEIQWAVRGWVPSDDPNHESYLIQRGVIYGQTDQEDPWNDLRDKVVNATFEGLPVSFMGVDSGHREQHVYAFCAANPICVPTKGRDTMDAWWKAVKPEVDTRGKTKRFGLKLWHLNSDVCKSWVHAAIKHSMHKEIIWHLPNDIDDEYCKQIAAESRMVKANGAVTWVKHRANHFLDVEAGCWFASHQVTILPERPLPASAKKAKRDQPVEDESWQPSDPYLR